MMLNLNTVIAATSAINAITSFTLGLVIFLRNPTSKLHQLWWYMSLAITVWATGLAFSFYLSPHNYSLGLSLLRMSNGAAIFVPLFFLHFIIVFLNRIDQKRILNICYSLSIPLYFVSFTPYYIKELHTVAGISNYNHAGPLYLLFVALYIIEPLYGIYLMWRARQALSGPKKAQVTHLMAAGIVGFAFGMTMFPACFGIEFPPIGAHFIWFYCLFVSWAAFKYQLFDFQIVIRKSLIYSILVTFLTVGYFGFIYGLERVFQTTLGYYSTWVSLGAFALMALLFQPLKIGIQRVVDLIIFQVPQEQVAKRMERLEEEAAQVEKQRAVATLAAGMAHEIKNPLTALKAFAEFIPEKKNDPAFLDTLHKTMTSETQRIQNIVQDLLDFAKPKPPQLKQIDLGELVTSTTNLLSSDLNKRHIKWALSCQHNGAQIQADPDQLRQVLINLIQNAADAMPKGGNITLETRTLEGYLELSIKDTGEGIPKELLSKIFDPFVTTKSTGNGLGLAMVQTIIKAHHGSIQAESTPGTGTTFTLRLPL